MDSQLILQNLAGEVRAKPTIVIKSDDAAKIIEYVENLERVLADMLRLTYERNHKPAA